MVILFRMIKSSWMKRGMLHPWEGREMHAEFYKENPTEKEYVEYINIGGRIILQ
jgi:hypothetical protein